MTPLQASSMALNRVQQYAMASMRAATNTQEVIDRIFSKIQDDYEKAEIKRASVEVRNGKNHPFIMEASSVVDVSKINTIAYIREMSWCCCRFSIIYISRAPRLLPDPLHSHMKHR